MVPNPLVLPPLLFVFALVICALVFGILRPRTLLLTMPAVAGCFAWGYVEIENGHWQMDSQCKQRAGQFIYERVGSITALHFVGDNWCNNCSYPLYDLGFMAIEFSVDSSWSFESRTAFNVEPGKTYRVTLQPRASAKCHPRYRDSDVLQRRRPQQCIVIEPIEKPSAPVTIAESKTVEHRFLGRIETWRTTYIRNADSKLLAETVSFVWRSNGPLARYYHAIDLEGPRLGLGEFTCMGEKETRWENIDKIVSPRPRR